MIDTILGILAIILLLDLIVVVTAGAVCASMPCTRQ